MSDATQADASQSQADSTDDTESQADSTGTISLDEAKKLRAEAASLRKRLRDAESKVQAAEDKDKTELQRAQDAIKDWERKHSEAQQRAREKAGRALVFEAARTANAVSANAVYALVRDGLDYGDDDEPTNVDKLIADAKKAEPSLFRAAPGSGDGGKGGNGKDTSNPNDLMNAFIRTGPRA